jgi:hypothetical protein
MSVAYDGEFQRHMQHYNFLRGTGKTAFFWYLIVDESPDLPGGRLPHNQRQSFHEIVLSVMSCKK